MGRCCGEIIKVEDTPPAARRVPRFRRLQQVRDWLSRKLGASWGLVHFSVSAVRIHAQIMAESTRTSLFEAETTSRSCEIASFLQSLLD